TLPRSLGFIAIHPEGKFLFASNYREGTLDGYQLDGDGKIKVESLVAINEGRPTAHCVRLSPDRKNLYVPYVKEHNALYQYAFDEDSGEITALDPLNAEPPEGTGPRHFVYHPDLPLVYFSEEQGLGVSVYERDSASGLLTFRESVVGVGPDIPETGRSASDIVITPDKRFIYIGIRGSNQEFDFVSGFELGEGGRPMALKPVPTADTPWGLAVTPDSRYLVVTASGAGEIIAYEIQTDGNLEKIASVSTAKGITDLEVFRSIQIH
ncbi:MAG: beta-propeller fold lactonase family protein, partial [Verrucomicrobiota bacterium]